MSRQETELRLVTYDRGDAAPRAGALIDGDTRIVDLLAASEARGPGRADARLQSIQALIEGGEDALSLARDAVDRAPASCSVAREGVRLLAPVPRPEQMRDCLCFEGHLKTGFGNLRVLASRRTPDSQAAMADFERRGVLKIPQVFYERPIYYKANRFAVIGTDTPVAWPDYCDILDFELEIGIFLSGTAKDVGREDAKRHIFGYTVFNDFSARDTQLDEMGALGPAKSKDFDTANAMGPCLVTADEIADPYDLAMVARVNGEEWTRGSTSTMMWKFEDLISFISRSETLHPGEFIGSGTVENGCGLEHLRFLNDGDVVELEIEGIGTLRNRVERKVRRA